MQVALRKESVDRNRNGGTDTGIAARSLSARRAWIEILLVLVLGIPTSVALRKESVDRNGMEINGVSYDIWSLSARRAWIEILEHLRSADYVFGRSPQGERG